MPFDAIEQLATPEVVAIARELVARKQERARAKADVENFFRSRERLLSEQAYRALRVAVRSGQPPAQVSGNQPALFTNYAVAATAVAATASELDASLEAETHAARLALLEASRTFLPAYFVFGSPEIDNLFSGLPPSEDRALAPRNSHERKRERHLLLYLQRVATKNDTFSEFGPAGWGKVEQQLAGITFGPRPGVAAREIFLERWIAHAIAAAMNADQDIFAELSPRLNPNGRIDDLIFVFTESGETAALTWEELETIKTCDGKTPAYAQPAPLESIRRLVEKKILRCAVEVPALDPYAFNVLRDDVGKWRAGEAREKWLSILQPIAALPQKFAAATEIADRKQILDEARSRLQSLGSERKAGDRSLYAATNPIGEECLRECNFSINEDLINEVANDAAPWIDFWRDSYAFVASRVAAGLRRVHEKVPSRNGAIPLPAFMRACEMAKLPLTGPGLVALAHMAFQEVKAAFRERMKVHVDKAEYELTADDCHVVRNNFEYPKFDEYTYPSADLQIAAESIDAVARADYHWILAELHPPPAMLHHCFYWSCPDKLALNRLLAKTACSRPNFHFGFSAADFTAHTTVRIFDAIPELSNFVAPQRGNPKWRRVAPADAEVYVDSTSGDVCVRKIDDHEHLGSFARAWIIPLGFHPFQFGMAPQMPRLHCGKVIVQRRAWTVTLEEFPSGDFTGISRDLLVAIERLRAEKNWPRYIYIRPTEQALRRSGAEGRDKDTKPVFIDLESYLFQEIFHRWLTKSGELEVTEMLPDPDRLLWREPDGHRTFELRTLILPR